MHVYARKSQNHLRNEWSFFKTIFSKNPPLLGIAIIQNDVPIFDPPPPPGALSDSDTP